MCFFLFPCFPEIQSSKGKETRCHPFGCDCGRNLMKSWDYLLTAPSVPSLHPTGIFLTPLSKGPAVLSVLCHLCHEPSRGIFWVHHFLSLLPHSSPSAVDQNSSSSATSATQNNQPECDVETSQVAFSLEIQGFTFLQLFSQLMGLPVGIWAGQKLCSEWFGSAWNRSPLHF